MSARDLARMPFGASALAAAVALVGCSSDQRRGSSESHDAPAGQVQATNDSGVGFSTPVSPPPPSSCTRHEQCGFPLACVAGRCEAARSCAHVEIEQPVLCFRFQDLADPASPIRQSSSVRLLVDGGVDALGTSDSFRCPEVDELRAEVAGEGAGEQPICGPDPTLASFADVDAGDGSVVCCYGARHVAGV